MPRAKLDKQPHEVAAMFDEVAARYDRTNDVLSLGLDRRWRLEVQRALDLRAGEKLLDLAAGTGTSSEPFADAGVLTVPCDFSLGMLQVGYGRRPDLGFVAGDATRLPFADDSFDAVTISFGLRNVVDVQGALAEMRRVTRHGGRLLICEFSHPTFGPWRSFYKNVWLRLLPVVARRTSSSPDSYVYLAESIRDWPDQQALSQRIAGAGWERVEFRNLTGGIVALHRAVKP
jgi:demethylmenaquinone methyltransferase/2-methoxy-6-polyprenyl-1,4-benzoquinol methylase